MHKTTLHTLREIGDTLHQLGNVLYSIANDTSVTSKVVGVINHSSQTTTKTTNKKAYFPLGKYSTGVMSKGPYPVGKDNTGVCTKTKPSYSTRPGEGTYGLYPLPLGLYNPPRLSEGGQSTTVHDKDKRIGVNTYGREKDSKPMDTPYLTETPDQMGATRPRQTKRRKAGTDVAKRTDVATTSPYQGQAHSLVERLSTHLITNGVKVGVTSKEWYNEAEKLLRIDKRNYHEALSVLDWCQRDTFWSSNIHSMKKFRQHYDKMRMKCEQESTTSMQTAATWLEEWAAAHPEDNPDVVEGSIDESE